MSEYAVSISGGDQTAVKALKAAGETKILSTFAGFTGSEADHTVTVLVEAESATAAVDRVTQIVEPLEDLVVELNPQATP